MSWALTARSLALRLSPCPRAPLLLRNCGAYKSIYSLDKLYPPGVGDVGATFSSTKESSGESREYSGDIPVDRLKVSYNRSSRPGGQNVNKVNTKAEVRFHVANADWLPQDIRDKLQEKYKHRIVRSGELIVTSQVSRYQMRNLADCLLKLRQLIGDAVTTLVHERRQDSPEEAAVRRSRSHS
ncbi:large ribosomal subunit protein mL62 isoform X2 [Petromyzon marinus]|uniref:large ribosomal subunit protein mL62 isoform X2 n=1 Tax=Petromyzon marinus TaxID=7757 RepID=UPI003F72E263